MSQVPPNNLGQLPYWHPPLHSPSSYGDMILNQYPGFKNSPVYKNGVEVYNATPERLNTNYGRERFSEFYFPGDAGGPNEDNLANPGNKNKAVLEIYNQDFANNPQLRKELTTGELLHGMAKDPYYAQLRNQFAQNFSPDANYKNQYVYNQWKAPGETFDQTMNRTIIDSYLRAGILPHDANSEEWTSVYTPQQQQILGQIKQYLQTGKKELGQPAPPLDLGSQRF